MNGTNSTDRVDNPRYVLELQANLGLRLGRQVRGLCLVSTGAGIVLRGKANTYYIKQLAQEILRQNCPLPIIANEIEVQ